MFTIGAREALVSLELLSNPRCTTTLAHRGNTGDCPFAWNDSRLGNRVNRAPRKESTAAIVIKVPSLWLFPHFSTGFRPAAAGTVEPLRAVRGDHGQRADLSGQVSGVAGMGFVV